MPTEIRHATPDDVPQLTQLLLADAGARHDTNPALWPLAPDGPEKTATALQTTPPQIRQRWLVAEADGRLLGATRSMLVPVPPIYAGDFGPPGFIMEECTVTPDAPEGTQTALLQSAEADLTKAGAQILLTSSIPGGPWEPEFARQGYAPLTSYLAKTGLVQSAPSSPATEDDIPGIVTASARHRSILNQLNPLFWKPHAEADTRFDMWMRRSLTLTDRDMFVAARGYAISQPITHLHIPAPHDISGIGIIDDFFHSAIADPQTLASNAPEATALLASAEAALAQRGNHAVYVVCPANWASKIKLLEQAGFTTAITWHIRMAH